ncbi:MAG: LruC domain-containing protein, partial [Bacteroidota bacterium]
IDTTFGCDPTFYQVIFDTLNKLDVVSGDYVPLGVSSDGNYNGIGYNDEDGLIYGFKKKGSDVYLWRLNPNGQETDLGQIFKPSSNYSTGNYKGDFDLNGNLYNIYAKGGAPTLGRLNVDSLPLTAYEIALTNLNGATTSVHDIAYNERFDNFYSVGQNGHLIRINHLDRTIEDLGDYSATIGSGPFGAVWCVNSGEIFFSQNTTGNIYYAALDNNGDPSLVRLQMVGKKASSNDGSGCARAESPFQDTDSDGIPNGNDDYPNDGEVAYSEFTPDKISYGSYAFEDFWPKKGDYDFNDLVVGYNYEAARDTLNQTHWVRLNFKLRALGAGFKSGFGISFDDILPSQIESVTGTSTSEISLEANGCESGQSKAVVVVFDNAHQEFDVPVGYFVNSQSGGVTRDPVTYSIKVTFANPVANLGTINPFIFSRGDRGYEIHLMNDQPTDLVNSSLVGTEDDQSAGSTYYVDSRGFPWGL